MKKGLLSFGTTNVCVFVVSPFFSHEEGASQFWNNKPWRIWVCTGLEQEAMAAKVEDDRVVFFLLIDFQQLKNLCGGVNLLCSQGKS